MHIVMAPLERARLLRDLYGLSFTPVIIASKEELFQHLEKEGKRPQEWGKDEDRTRSFEDLWEEFTEDDCVLAILPGGEIGRFIRTVTIYITRDKPYYDKQDRNRGLKVTPEVLREFIIWPGGKVEERPYINSGSEKLKWSENHPTYAIRRFFYEELSLQVSKKYRRHPYMVELPRAVSYYKQGSTNLATEVDMHASRSYPGVVTYNRLYHYFWKMPQRYWKEIYREIQKNKTLEFRWKPVR